MARYLSKKLASLLLLAVLALLSLSQLARHAYNSQSAPLDALSTTSPAAVASQIDFNDSLLATGIDQTPLDDALLDPSHEEDSQSGHHSTLEALVPDKADAPVEPISLSNSPQQFDYREIFSLTTADRKFIPIYLGGFPGYNANLIPHPTKADFWIVVAQHEEAGKLKPAEQLVCTAGILNGAMICTEQPTVMPVVTGPPGSCEGDLSFIVLVNGPRDARMFYGPDVPYVMYGAQSGYICFGQWLQDARTLLDEFAIHRYMKSSFFQQGVELRRPADARQMEKNYFVFWDRDGVMYAHYNIWPTRSFAQLNWDGNGLSDLAPTSAYDDQVCMAKFFPSVLHDFEAIHQATNSLSITLCRRTDFGCIPDDSNTFIMHIFHHKSFYQFHAMYEPFVVLFQRTAPFALHAVSQRPFWIHGRNNLTVASDSTQYRDKPDAIPPDHTELFYITSMSWKSHSQKYHGYLDDTLFVAFGIEDARPGVVDVLAGDLLQDLAFC